MDASLFPLIFVGFVFLAILMAYLANEAAKKRRAAFEALAARLGFSYYPEGIQNFTTHSLLGFQFQSRQDTVIGSLANFRLFNEGDSRRAAPVLAGHVEGVNYFLFDYQYETTSTDSEGRTTTTTHHFAVLAAQTPYRLPHLTLLPQGFFHKIGQLFGAKELQVESEEFNRRFFIETTDPRLALDILHPQAMEFLLARDVRPWCFDGDFLMTYLSGRQDPQVYEYLLGEVSGWLKLVPEYYRQDRANA